MHYLGAVTEQLTHEDPRVATARRQARQRRDARQALRQAPTERPAPRVFLTRARAVVARRPVRLFAWHGILPHHR